MARRLFGGMKVNLPNPLQGEDEERKEAAADLAEAQEMLQRARTVFVNPDALYYIVTTESEDGIGIRETPDLKGARTGDDCAQFEFVEVDEIVEAEGEPTFLHLKDGRGWIFDTSPIDPDNPSAQRVAPCTLEDLKQAEAAVMEAKRVFHEVRGGKLLTPEEWAAEEEKKASAKDEGLFR